MPVCVRFVEGSNGATFARDGTTVVNADGTATFAPRTDYQNCELILQTGSEFSNWDQLTHMTIDEANLIGAGIALVWAIAWGFRAMRMAVMDYAPDGD